MQFQLVLQFSAGEEIYQFDELIALEDDLIRSIQPTSEVDGHDSDSNEFNIFILTDHPRETFKDAQKVVEKHHLSHQLRAAYREQGEDEYVILWPEQMETFRVA